MPVAQIYINNDHVELTVDGEKLFADCDLCGHSVGYTLEHLGYEVTYEDVSP